LDPVAEALKQKQNLPRREFVLRFILENGKQFLVQFNSKRETIAWLQVRCFNHDSLLSTLIIRVTLFLRSSLQTIFYTLARFS
jgi:hypothetical protein